MVITWIAKIFASSETIQNLLVSYCSITIIGMAIIYVELFSRLKLGTGVKKVITFFTPAVFGVYLIHVHPAIFFGVLKNAFISYANDTLVIMIIKVLATAAGIMFGCLIIDKIRLICFEILRINKLVWWIGKRLDDLVIKLNAKEESMKL